MIGAGNSLEHLSYKNDISKICRGLDRWMSVCFSNTFKNCGQVLPIGTQLDGTSCGVCVLNSLEHALLDIRLFTHKHRDDLRVQCFTKIMSLLIDQVSAMLDILRE